jgi:thiosulfate/3-mercaptopyruvate sulfurtransferase
MKKLFYFVAISLLAVSVNAQIITVDALSKIVKDPSVVVIDARASADYLKTHIDGAINLDVTALCNKTPVEGTLKPSSELATILGKHGITRTGKIVVYCKTGVNAGRMYWILKYLGCTDVSILDGQMDGWFAARKPITKVAKTPKPATFTPVVNTSIFANKAYVKSKIGAAGVVIIDTRKADEFAAGNITGAINIPHESMLSGETKLKTTSALQTIFTNAGVSKDKEVILYCKTSTTAGLTYFVLTSLLGYTKVKVYDGAYLDWQKQ